MSGDKAQISGSISNLVECSISRLSFSLAGVFSQKSAIVDQRRVVDDFSSIPDWPLAGLSKMIEAPRTLIYFFHYLHGAICMDLSRDDLALQLADTPLRWRGQDGEPAQLWRQRDLVAGPMLFGGDLRMAWEYLIGMPNQFPVLGQFFALQKDFEIGLASYSMLLSLYEAGQDCRKVLAMPEQQLKTFNLAVLPMFALMDSDTIRSAYQHTFGNTDVVDRVTKRSRVSREELKRLWPHWKAALQRYNQDLFPFKGSLPLGDIAGER